MEKFTARMEMKLPLGIQKTMLYALAVKVLIIILSKRRYLMANTYNEDTIREAVDIATGDDGRTSAEVIDILKILQQEVSNG
jgi:hypothetical protein